MSGFIGIGNCREHGHYVGEAGCPSCQRTNESASSPLESVVQSQQEGDVPSNRGVQPGARVLAVVRARATTLHAEALMNFWRVYEREKDRSAARQLGRADAFEEVILWLDELEGKTKTTQDEHEANRDAAG